MNYKAVIEEQIRELQKVQDNATKEYDPDTICRLAVTIADLTLKARDIQ